MSWNDVWKIIISAVMSVGGVSAIIVIAIKFAANTLARRLEERYTLKLNKSLEEFKSGLEKKNYISQVRFDKEFEMYQELSSSFANLIQVVNELIPCGVVYKSSNEEIRRKEEEDIFQSLANAFLKAREILNANIPFISKDFYKHYEELLELSNKQINAYIKRFNIFDSRPLREKEQFSDDDYSRTKEINKSWKRLNEEIREYLQSLDVKD